jgi:hypothetical protein
MPAKKKEPSLLNEEYVAVDLPQQRITITRSIRLSELTAIKKWFAEKIGAPSIVIFEGTIKWRYKPPVWKRIEGEVTKIGRTRLHITYFQREGNQVGCWLNGDGLQIHPDEPFTVTFAKKDKVKEENPVRTVRHKLGPYVEKDRFATLLEVEPGEVVRCELMGDLPRDEKARQNLQWLGRKYGLDILGEDNPAGEGPGDPKPSAPTAARANQEQIEEMAKVLAFMLKGYRNFVPQVAPALVFKALQDKKKLIKRAEKILNDVYSHRDEE